MITKNVDTLKMYKLTQEQYDRELAAGRIDETALYLTPDKTNDKVVRYDQQELTEEQKAQVRENIGAVSNSTLPKTTVNDAGKFLRIASDGTIVASFIINAEEEVF